MIGDVSREKILEAAGPVFADYGFEKATVREICRRAGTNVASINYHFGGKESLYRELVRRIHIQEFNADLRPDLNPADPPEIRLREFSLQMLRSATRKDRNSWQFRLMFQEMLNPTGVLNEIVNDFIRPHFQMLLDILNDVLPPGTPLGLQQRVGFTLISHCAFYHLHSELIGQLVNESDRELYFSLDALAEYITSITMASARLLQPAETNLPVK